MTAAKTPWESLGNPADSGKSFLQENHAFSLKRE
jgi:hypothetical protein